MEIIKKKNGTKKIKKWQVGIVLIGFYVINDKSISYYNNLMDELKNLGRISGKSLTTILILKLEILVTAPCLLLESPSRSHAHVGFQVCLSHLASHSLSLHLSLLSLHHWISSSTILHLSSLKPNLHQWGFDFFFFFFSVIYFVDLGFIWFVWV